MIQPQETYRSLFRDHVDRLLDPSDGIQELNAVRELSEIFREITGGDEKLLGSFIDTRSGRALSPKSAADCFYDVTRVQVFLRGICDAVREAQKRFPNEKIKILYAGCGPFAALGVLLASQFSPKEIEILPIEIQEVSAECARQVIKVLGLELYMPEVIHGNAAKYRNDGQSPHVIVTETMYQGLLNEPQAAITANLAPQLKEGGIFVPERVDVSAWLASEKGGLSLGQQLGTLACLRADSRSELRSMVDAGVNGRFEIFPFSERQNVILSTRVKVFGSHNLTDYDSLVTMPRRIGQIDALQRTELVIKYRFGDDCDSMGMIRHRDEAKGKDVVIITTRRKN